MIVLSGVAATQTAHVQGHVLLRGAIDENKRVPLCASHDPKRVLGEVTHLKYFGGDLHIRADVDGDISKLGNFLSPGGKPLERVQRGDFWHVTKFRLDEISIVMNPANPKCVIFERKQVDNPFRALARERSRELDLYKQAFLKLSEGLQLVGRL